MGNELHEISVEVVDAVYPAASWQHSYGDVLTAAALGCEAKVWRWCPFRWGVVLEIGFPDEASFEVWRTLPSVIAALDAAPDPVHGLIVKQGWGGTSGDLHPRRPRPVAGAGAAELPLPEEVTSLDAVAHSERSGLGAAVGAAARA